MKKYCLDTYPVRLGLVSLAALFFLFACKEEAKKEDYTVNISYGGALCHAPLHIAFEKKFFEEEGLKISKVSLGTDQTIDAAATGKIDAGYGLLGKFAQPIENGLNIKFTAGMHTGCIKIVVKNDSPINSVKELKGKKIGVGSLADSPAIIAKRALANAGISVDPKNLEVDLIVYPNADLPAALDNGAIDAYAAMDPAVSVAIKQNNYKVLLNTATSEPFNHEFCCASFVTAKFAQEHPDAALKFTKALIKAAHWIQANPDSAAKIQIDAKYVFGDVEFNGQLLSEYDFNANVKGGRESFEATLKALKEINVLRPDTDVEALAKKAFISYDIK
jgi:NitT/TauT family transport system substrate-binding protein